MTDKMRQRISNEITEATEIIGALKIEFGLSVFDRLTRIYRTLYSRMYKEAKRSHDHIWLAGAISVISPVMQRGNELIKSGDARRKQEKKRREKSAGLGNASMIRDLREALEDMRMLLDEQHEEIISLTKKLSVYSKKFGELKDI